MQNTGNIVKKIWTPTSIDKPPIWHPSLYIFFPSPHIWQHSFGNITLVKYGINTKINESYFFMLTRLQNKVMFFYKQHQTEIWSEIRTFSSIKRIQKKIKHCKWKTCWVKSIITAKSLYYYTLPSSISNSPHMDFPTPPQPPFLQENLEPTFYDFWKISNPGLSKAGSHFGKENAADY